MILELTLVQELAGQQLINRWNYVSSGTPVGVTNSQALMSAMGFIPSGSPAEFPTASIGYDIRSLQSVEVSFIQCLARNIYPSADFYELPYVGGFTGKVTGACSPPFVSYGFNTTRVTTAIRRGQKRIGGVPVSAVSDAGAIDSAALTALNSLATAMGDTLTYTDGGNSLSFVPTIVSKEKYETPAGNDAYRYYSTEVAQLAHIAQGFVWDAKSVVRSQTSRQYGRGK
jgi:hypothetical protein